MRRKEVKRFGMTAKPAKPGAQSGALGQEIEAGIRVLRLESDALKVLADSLDQSFSNAVTLFSKCTGRIVVSGMGKSGHIARKVAATFASTGAPAQFVHPAEASHGDMGAITAADVVLLFSNSGETKEIGDLVAHTRRHQIPLIGVASRADSMLIRSSDVALVLPSVDEACPMGLAPTTSTTLMLGLGDALAVALMEKRGFSSDDYRVLHPGGELGKSLIRVEDIMHAGDAIPIVSQSATMPEVIQQITEKQLGCTGLVDDNGCLVGIITDGDLRRQIGSDLMGRDVMDVMTADPRTIWQGALAAEAVGLMNRPPKPITCLFVVGDPEKGSSNRRQKPIGILHLHDCLRAGIS